MKHAQYIGWWINTLRGVKWIWLIICTDQSWTPLQLLLLKAVTLLCNSQQPPLTLFDTEIWLYTWLYYCSSCHSSVERLPSRRRPVKVQETVLVREKWFCEAGSCCRSKNGANIQNIPTATDLWSCLHTPPVQ